MFASDPILRSVGNGRWVFADDLAYHGNTETFTIEAGFECDLGSIPRVLWWVLSPTDYVPEYGLHDWLWHLNRAGGGPDPVDSDGLFRRSLRQAGAGVVVRWGAWWAVRATAVVCGRPGRWGRWGGVAFFGGSLAVPVFALLQVGQFVF